MVRAQKSKRHEWQRVDGQTDICRHCAMTSCYEDRYIKSPRAPFARLKHLRVLRYPDGREASIGSPMAPCEGPQDAGGFDDCG